MPRFSRPCRRRPTLVVTLFAVTVACTEARADLSTWRIRSVEWMVDQADVIAIVRKPTTDGAAHEVLQTLKGDAASLRWPLEQPSTGLYPLVRFSGPIDLIFVRGRSELLGDVSLSRELPLESPALDRICYGVTQYGELLFTESRLLAVVRERLKMEPPKPIARLWIRFSPDEGDVDAPDDFPLQASNEEFLLIVPHTADRRDHFIKVLQSGDAAERIYAAEMLSSYDDSQARQALREATTIKSVEPAYGVRHYQRPAELTAADVRQAAEWALRPK